MVVEDADTKSATYPGENVCQLEDEIGSFTQAIISGYNSILLDGSEVYGSKHPDGWLSVFKRTFVEAKGGVTFILDSYATHPNRSALNISEYFYSYHNPSPAACNMDPNSIVTVNANSFTIVPDCLETFKSPVKDTRIRLTFSGLWKSNDSWKKCFE